MSALNLVDRLVAAGAALSRARVERVDAVLGPLVSCPPGQGEPVQCDVLRTGAEAPVFSEGDEVLVAVVGGGTGGHVILGTIFPGSAATVVPTPIPPAEGAEPAGPQGAPRVIDGRTIRIEAGEELILQCGAGSITLTRDGRVIMRGEHVLSRARGTNRIKGGSVAIN